VQDVLCCPYLDHQHAHFLLFFNYTIASKSIGDNIATILFNIAIGIGTAIL